MPPPLAFNLDAPAGQPPLVGQQPAENIRPNPQSSEGSEPPQRRKGRPRREPPRLVPPRLILPRLDQDLLNQSLVESSTLGGSTELFEPVNPAHDYHDAMAHTALQAGSRLSDSEIYCLATAYSQPCLSHCGRGVLRGEPKGQTLMVAFTEAGTVPLPADMSWSLPHNLVSNDIVEKFNLATSSSEVGWVLTPWGCRPCDKIVNFPFLLPLMAPLAVSYNPQYIRMYVPKSVPTDSTILGKQLLLGMANGEYGENSLGQGAGTP